ncbi:DUF6119 family protein [Sphingomonas canadensis]|uniref:DUF6119 family protein n=1 Tax=Sphingomonas canadensis TaxID=1219257 RepID=A0ABW3H8Z6_9SPHN|nr:DUF6119 family protein [Sphingomonas canadensis]MCW3837078.1 TIGR04141 family sporadically distributed protein [Sphingomonas canadensis]
MAKAPTVSLTLRLLRNGITAEGALKDDHGLEEIDSTAGRLFVGQSPAIPPSWAKFLAHYTPDGIVNLRTQSCSAAMLIDVGKEQKKRLFALCFGQGHHALDEDAIQRGFGLRVVLNSVSRGKLRTLDSASLDTTVMQRRVQASRDSDLSAFDLDANRNLLRLASGTPKSGDFAKALAGKDALHFRAAVDPDKLVEHCEKALKLYEATDYKTDFAFIDYVQPVGERVLTEELDTIVFQDLKAMVQGNPSDLHLAIPDILSPDAALEIGYFGTGLSPGPKTAYGELAIEDYVVELQKGDFGQIADMAALKGSHEIRVVADGEGDRSHKRKLYTCFVHEVTLRNNIYVLFDGQWFGVSKDYHKEIEDAYTALLKPAFRVKTTADNERALITELEGEANLISMDQTKVAPKGAANAALEPCDFLSQTKQLIHLKDGHSSAPLSHLWNQGVVSAEAFVSDEVFRKGFRAAAQKREKKFKKQGFAGLLPDGRTKPVPGDYTIVFGVMRHPYAASGQVGLPFFSKVALRAAAERISRMGFPVELHLIEKK